MVTGYRNIIDNRNGSLKLFTWNEAGKRVSYDVSHAPYLMLEDNRGEYTSIFNTKLKKYEFRNSYDRTKFITNKGLSRVFENIKPEQQYLIDTFWQHAHKKEFVANPLKIQYLDIETYSPEGFPRWEDPTDTINVITLYDTIDETYYTWGLGDWKEGQHESNPANVKYIKCSDEEILLEKFIEFIRLDFPDILTGWNCVGFDFPYLISRINRVLGDGAANALSPVNKISTRTMLNQFKQEQTRFYIEGVSCIDYMDVYKKFIFVNRTSFKLDNIAEIELGDNKVDYGNLTLWELADKNWQLFVDYNIQDVRILVRLDEKLKFMGLLRMFANVGCCTFEQAMGAIAVINGSIAIGARRVNKRIPQFIRKSDSTEKNPGAYVCVHNPGFNDSVVSFDANSLYPSVMISCNISPETKIGKIIGMDDGMITIKAVDGTIVKNSVADFLKGVKDNDIAISSAKVLYSQKEKGIVPTVLDGYYDERVQVKNEMLKVKKELAQVREKIKYLQLS